uniref:E3 ubiquitin-protein ligase E3D n=2 Tax=Schistocephalus solidus TaxID=70667 RepID=A0A0V0JA76_SCHSO
MVCLDFFAEYTFGLHKLTVTIVSSKIAQYKFSVCSPGLISIKSDSTESNVLLDNLDFSPDTCSISAVSSPVSVSFSLLAKSESSPYKSTFVQRLLDLICKGEALLCRFCQGKLVNIKDVCKMDTLFSVDDLAESEAQSFCHSNNANSAGSTNLLSKIAENIPISSGLCNGVEMLFNPSVWFPHSTVQTSSSDELLCARCRLVIGRTVNTDENAGRILWTNCVSVWIEEFDVDGDYLRHIEAPLILNDTDFFALLFSQFLDAKCYRVILSAGTCDSVIPYALIWLFDQKVRLYTASIEDPPSDAEEHDAANTPRVLEMHAEKILVSRVLYTILRPQEEEKADERLKEWSSDFSVASLTLPWETCANLYTCLSQVTRRLPPGARSGTGAMQGFMVGGFPLSE